MGVASCTNAWEKREREREREILYHDIFIQTIGLLFDELFVGSLLKRLHSNPCH